MKLQITPSDVLNLIGQIATIPPHHKDIGYDLHSAHQVVEEYFKIKIDFEIVYLHTAPPLPRQL